jgi:mannose/cellobiose epimerase-like protein (N-acyl-D-glucosamine 2-epimerase family)
MIDINLCLEMAEVIKDLNIEERVKENIDQIFNEFYDEKNNLLRENYIDDEESMDTFEGRLINPDKYQLIVFDKVIL